ncbi:MAG: UvrABC system protein, partial [Actinomycetota bacterium]
MEKRRTPPRVRRSSHVREHRRHDGGRYRAHPAESNQEETITTMSLSRPENIPTAPGVYQYLDRDGRVLYVGKAKNLRHRISSYFNG